MSAFRPTRRTVVPRLERLEDRTVPSTTLLCTDQDGKLYTLDVATGAVVVKGTLRDAATGSIITINDLTFDRFGNLFGIDDDEGEVYRINPETAVSTFVGKVSVAGLIGLVFARDGTLYAAGDDLYSINKETGQGMRIRPLGADIEGDLAVDAAGTLYVSTSDVGLARVDPAPTGDTQAIGQPFPFSEVFGLAFGRDGVMYGVSNEEVVFAVDRFTGEITRSVSFAGRGVRGVSGATSFGESGSPGGSKGMLLSSTQPSGQGGVGGIGVIVAPPAPTFANAAGRLGRGNPNAVRYLVTGTDVGGGPIVRVFDFQSGVERAAFFAYDLAFTGGVRVASADVTGDGVADIITAAGTGGGPHVKVFNGVTFQLVREFFAYDPGFRGGVYVAAADVTGDGVAEVVTGAGEGGGAHVRVFTAVGPLAEFFAYDPAFRGGVRVAAADFNADGRADIATGAGVGGGPHVRVFDGRSFQAIREFLAFDPNFRGGVFVSANNTSGDTNGDGRPDLVVGAGRGGQALVNVYNGVDFSSISSFLAYDATFTGGMRVGLLDANGDGRADVIVGSGAGRGAFVRLVDLVSTRDLEFFQAYTPAYLGGVFVAGA